MSGRERFASSKDVEIQTSRFFSDLIFILFLSGLMECFCTQDAFHIRIRKDCSEQVCAWVLLSKWCALELPAGCCFRVPLKGASAG